MQKEDLINIFIKYQGKIIGSLIGLLIAILFLTIGFFKTVLILILIFGGFYIGDKIDKKESLVEVLDRILPPGVLK